MIVKAIVFSLLLSLAALNIQPAIVWADDSATTSEKAEVTNKDRQRIVDYAGVGCLFGLVIGFVLPGAGNVIGCAMGALVGSNLAVSQF